MKPAEFLDVAKLISGPSGLFPIGRQRSAVSRSYYAAFLEARDRLVALGKFDVPKKGAHETVWRAFAFSEQPLKKIGRLLEDLKKMRERADYEMEEDLSHADVQEAIRLCQDIQTALQTANLSAIAHPVHGRR